MMIKIKRIYDDPQPSDGTRILVDRLWPRGMSKERAKVDLWLKDAAPSPDLRMWFSHDPKRWEEFRKRYREELKTNRSIDDIRKMKGNVTLLYAAKDELHNHASVLLQFLKGKKKQNK